MPLTIDRDTPHQRDYAGFSHWDGMAGKTDRIAIAVFDGEANLFAVDNGVALADVRGEIERYYRDDFDRGPERIDFYASYDFINRTANIQ